MRVRQRRPSAERAMRASSMDATNQVTVRSDTAHFGAHGYYERFSFTPHVRSALHGQQTAPHFGR